MGKIEKKTDQGNPIVLFISAATKTTDSNSTQSPVSPGIGSYSSIKPSTSRLSNDSSTASKTRPLHTLKKFITKPTKTVLKHPVQSLIAHVVIKAFFYFIAQTVPMISLGAIVLSVGLFDRVVILNPRKYLKAILQSAKNSWNTILNTIKNKFQSIFPARKDSSSSPKETISTTTTTSSSNSSNNNNATTPTATTNSTNSSTTT